VKALAPKSIAATEETIPAAEQATSGIITGASGQPPIESNLPQVVLQGGKQSINAAAEMLFTKLAESQQFFVKGGNICYIEADETQRLDLKPLSAVQFASEIERHVQLFKETDEGLVPAVISARDVKTIMASRKAREILPAVRKVVHRPVLSVTRGKVEALHYGYHPDNGQVLVLTDQTLSLINPAEAVANILDVIKGFPFASEADRGRAVALIMTIAMVEMGFLEGVLRPMIMIIANASQSGKSLLIHVACIINELTPLLLSNRGRGGVGSLDESIGHGFEAGGVLALDNLRGKFDSEYLESAITARSAIMVRQPYSATVAVKLDEVTVTGTSNGVHLTPDQINRILFVHLQKKTERAAGSETEVELIARIKTELPTLRNSIASLIASWWEQGRQSIHAPNSYRVEWSGYLNWMVQEQFGLPPLMENHGQIADILRAGDRQQILDICMYIDIARRTGEALRAKEVVEILHDFVEEDAALVQMDHKKFGLLMKSLLRGTNTLELDGWKITRTTKHDEPGSRGEPVQFWQFDQVRSVAVTAVENAKTPVEPLTGVLPIGVFDSVEKSATDLQNQAQQTKHATQPTTTRASKQRPRLTAPLAFKTRSPSTHH